MNARGPASDWAPGVIGFLSKNLPRCEDGGGWDHMFCSAYQMGCEALIALGQAIETDSGAIPLADPALPCTLPRWDDICIVVLWLAEQRDALSYLLPDGTNPPERPGRLEFVVVPTADERYPPVQKIGSTDVLGPAEAAPEVLPVLQTLGLVADGHWAENAETVLWRKQPRAWGMDIPSDPRFADAVQKAINTIPHGIRAEIDRLVIISDKEVEASFARDKIRVEELRVKFGPKARIFGFSTLEETRRALIFARQNELDWLFFRRWRLPDGWLTTKQAEPALGVFHDPLAIQMRRAVLGTLYPEYPDFSE